MSLDDLSVDFRCAIAARGPALSAGHLDDDVAARFAHDKWADLAATGLLALPFPERWGGLEQDLITTLEVLETLGETCRDGGLCFVATTSMASTGVPIVRFGTDTLRQRYLPGICDGTLIGAHAITEERGGSDALQMLTTATPHGDDFVLSGSKAFVSNGSIADVVVVYARTHPRGGPLGITSFAVDATLPGVEFSAPIAKMGLRTSPLTSLFLDDVRVPAHAVVGRLNGGFRVLDHVMKHEILMSFVVCVGQMQHRLDRCVEQARTRQQFGRSIGSFQSIANKLVDMRIAVETARKWLYDTAHKLVNRDDVTTDLAITKLLVSRANVSTGLDAVQVFGASGYTSEYGLEKGLRDAVGGTIYSGTTEIQYNRIASSMGL